MNFAILIRKSYFTKNDKDMSAVTKKFPLTYIELHKLAAGIG